jgi:uncharacterized protein (TIGR02594 family)
VTVTAYYLAARFLGAKEAAGGANNPLVVAMMQLTDKSVSADAVPWCSGFVNWVCWLLELPRSKSLAARSWLTVGAAVALSDARIGFDVVVLRRGEGPQPGPQVTSGAPGHVGFFAGLVGADRVAVLGGNQSDAVSVATFPISHVLGVRRLAS